MDFLIPSLRHFLVLGTILFALGMYGVLSRRNAIGILLSIELMLNGVNVLMVAFARYIASARSAGAGRPGLRHLHHHPGSGRGGRRPGHHHRHLPPAPHRPGRPARPHERLGRPQCWLTALVILGLPLLALRSSSSSSPAATASCSRLAWPSSRSAIADGPRVHRLRRGDRRQAGQRQRSTGCARGPARSPSGESSSSCQLGIQVDPLTAIMLIVVTTVSFLVHVYSRGYMVEHGHVDPGYSRFFA